MAALSEAGKEDDDSREEVQEITRTMEEIKATLRRETEEKDEQAKGESIIGVGSAMDELD